jgi:hypothetical protein
MRKPTPSAAPQPAGADDQRTFTSWKLSLLTALLSDRKISDGHFRIAARVLEAVNAETGVAYITDRAIADDVPRTDKSKCTAARKQLQLAGWWTYAPGRSGRATEYRFKDERVNQILDQRLADREQRQAEREERAKSDRRKHDIREGSFMPRKPPSPRTREGKFAPRSDNREGEYGPSRAGEFTPLHLTTTPSAFSSSEEEELGAPPLDEEDWQAAVDERAAILEYDQGLPRAEAEARAREEMAWAR